MKMFQVSIIGGGAAGFFAAISCKAHYPSAEVTLYEKTNKLLAKVKVSGGGRCNVTHACLSNAQLVKFYPRGGSRLKKVFSQFSVEDTIAWFESRGVKLKTEKDNRMFPITDNSQTIIDCLVNEARKLGVLIEMNANLTAIEKKENGFVIRFADKSIATDKIIIATGGSPKLSGFQWLQDLGHTIIPPVPSLFTFNMPHEPVRELMGVSVENVSIKIQGAQLVSDGALLITHWGMSGPAVLKLSSFAARILHEMDYCFTVMVNWLGSENEEKAHEFFEKVIQKSGNRKISGKNPCQLPNRLWLYFLGKLNIPVKKNWNELSKKDLNRLIHLLTNDTYKAEGKTTFKDEFVTCGGVSIEDVNFETMESKICTGIFFAGEVLDIDGLTGGFNFQAAWSTGYIAGKSVDKPMNFGTSN